MSETPSLRFQFPRPVLMNGPKLPRERLRIVTNGTAYRLQRKTWFGWWRPMSNGWFPVEADNLESAQSLLESCVKPPKVQRPWTVVTPHSDTAPPAPSDDMDPGISRPRVSR